jgi:hypothetical protein
MRVPAGDIEALVLDRLRAFFSSRTDIGDALAPLDLEARAFDAALRSAFTLFKRWLAMPPVEMKSLVLDIVERVTIAANRMPFPGLRRLSLHQNPGETLHIRRLENGLERPGGRSRPPPWRFASPVGTDELAG